MRTSIDRIILSGEVERGARSPDARQQTYLYLAGLPEKTLADIAQRAGAARNIAARIERNMRVNEIRIAVKRRKYGKGSRKT